MRKSIFATLAIILGVALCWAAPPIDKLPSLLTTPAEARITSVIVGGSPPAGTSYATPAYVNSDGQNDATVDAVEIATNGTGLYYGSDTTITGPNIENGHLMYLDFDDTDAPAMVKITIYGYYDSNVN